MPPPRRALALCALLWATAARGRRTRSSSEASSEARSSHGARFPVTPLLPAVLARPRGRGAGLATPRLDREGRRQGSAEVGEGLLASDRDGRLWAKRPRSGPSSVEPQLTAVRLRTSGNRLGHADVVDVPSDWESLFAPKSLRYINEKRPGPVLTAMLRGSQSCPIAFKHMDADDPLASREVSMLNFLSRAMPHSGYIARSLEVRQSALSIFILLGGIDRTLEAVTDRPYSPPPGGTHAPSATILQTAIALLRGARDLEKAGVVHGGIDEMNVFMYNDQPRISGFGSSCIEGGGDSDEALGCGDLRDMPDAVPETSAFRQAPEMRGGRPTGPENHVFMIGLIIARLTLGEVPTKTAVLEHYRPPPPAAEAKKELEQQEELDGGGSGRGGDRVAQIIKKDELAHLDQSPEGRELVRDIVREHFDVRENKAFRALQDSNIQDFLAGMLERSPKERMTTMEALRFAERLAEGQKVKIKDEPASESDNLPEYFWRCWQ